MSKNKLFALELSDMPGKKDSMAILLQDIKKDSRVVCGCKKNKEEITHCEIIGNDCEICARTILLKRYKRLLISEYDRLLKKQLGGNLR